MSNNRSWTWAPCWTAHAIQQPVWACPRCGESLGEPETVTSSYWQGDDMHGGRVEESEDCCSICVKESRLRDCEEFGSAEIERIMNEYREELRKRKESEHAGPVEPQSF